MCSSMMPTARRVLTSGTTTGQFIPMTGWIPAINVKEMKALLQLRDKTDNFQVQVALQTADVDTDTPNTALGKGTFAAANGKSSTGMLVVSANVDGAYFVRWGVFVKNSSGTALERGEVLLSVGFRS